MLKGKENASLLKNSIFINMNIILLFYFIMFNEDSSKHIFMYYSIYVALS